MRKSKKLVAVAIVSMMMTRPAWAIFGVGDVVFDPAAVGQWCNSISSCSNSISS